MNATNTSWKVSRDASNLQCYLETPCLIVREIPPQVIAHVGTLCQSNASVINAPCSRVHNTAGMLHGATERHVRISRSVSPDGLRFVYEPSVNSAYSPMRILIDRYASGIARAEVVVEVTVIVE